MAELGQIGGLNYRMTFPSQAYGGGEAVPTQQQVTAPTLPDADDPLANRRALTARYYDSYAALQNIVRDATAQGIDPFKPDYSQAGGGLAHQAFQEAQANLMYAANALKGEFEAEKQMRPLLAQGQTRLKAGVDQNGLYASDPNNFTPTAIDPLVIEANKVLGDNRYTQPDSDRLNQAVRDPRVKFFQEQIAKDPQNAEYYNRQIEALLANTPQVYAPAAFDRDGSGKKYEYQTGLLRKYTNLKNGVWSPGTYSQTIHNGKVYLKNEESKGDVLGKYQTGTDSNGNPVLKDKVLDYWLKDPSTGKVFYKYTDPNIPIEEASNQSGDAVTRTFVSNNSKYGSVDKIIEAATAQGLTNEQGSSIDPLLMPENFTEIQDSVRNSASKTSGRIEGVVNTLKKQLRELEDPFMGNNWVAYTLHDGRKLQVAKHRGKSEYYIKNWEDMGFPKEPKNLAIDDVISFLSNDFNYFNQYLENQPAKTQPNNNFDPDI